MALDLVQRYNTRDLAVQVDSGARTVLPGTNVTFSTDPVTGAITINSTAGGSGTVTSVGLAAPTGFTVSGSPVTTTGTLTFSYTAGYVGYTTAEQTKLAGIAPGATANVGTVTSVNLGASTGLTPSGGPITTSGSLTYTLSANLLLWNAITPSGFGGSYVLKAGDTMSGTLNGTSFVASGSFNSAQNFISTTTNWVAGTTGAGTIWFRPNGVGSTSGQWSVDSAGNLSGVSITASSTITAGNEISSTGSSAGLRFNDRGGAGNWTWYSTGNVAHLYSTTLAGDAVDINSAGALTARASLQASSGVIRAQGYAGSASSGVYYMGDTGTDCYMYKPSGLSQINFKRHTSVAESILDTSGTILTTGNFNPATKLDYRASLDVYAAIPASTDWNNANVNGWWMAYAATNAPHADWNIGMVTVHNNDWIQQEVWNFTEAAYTTKYRRHKQAGTWSAWTFDQFFGPHFFVGQWSGGVNYGGVMANNGKYLIMTGTADLNTYVGAKAGGNVVIRANDNDGSREVRITSAGGFEATQTISDVAGNVRDIPQDLANTSFTLVIGDAGRHVISTNTTNYNWTIPTNASVAFPIGTAITFVHDSTSGTKTIVRAGGVALISGTTDADFALTAGMVRTILKVGSDRWRVV